MKNETKNDELATAERTVKIDYIKIVIHTEVFDRKRNNKTRRRPVGLGQSIKLIQTIHAVNYKPGKINFACKLIVLIVFF